MFEKAIVSLLKNASDVTALIGTGDDARVRPGYLEEDWDLPALTYSRMGTDREHAMDGPISLANPRIEVLSWAATFGAAQTLAEKVRLALDGVTKATHGGIDVRLIWLDHEDSEEYRFPPAGNTFVHVIAQEYEMQAVEAVA
jgi:hypothetical protein